MAAILTEQLTKFYGSNRGLDGLDLEVRSGEIFGFLGPNGAGKTTTIRLLLDVIRPTSGHAEVLGVEPRKGSVALRRRIGYLPGDFVADGRQTSRDYLVHLGHLRGGIANTAINQLADRLDLDLGARFSTLSKGNRQKVGLVQAFMHQPDLLILDEPTSGLDPLMQQRFLTMVREAKGAGQTVFMSSHVLSEVQDVADRAGIVREGKLVITEDVEELRRLAVRQVRITFADPIPSTAFTTLPGVEDIRIDGTMLFCTLRGGADGLVKAAGQFTVLDLVSAEPDLEELFFTFYGAEHHAA